jgi:hypothetical protein
MLDDTTTTAPNWDPIKADFEAGTLAIRAIARREGISDTSIHKKAKSDGWDASLRKQGRPANPTFPGLQTEVQTHHTEVEPAVECTGERFDWDPENKCILVPESRALALYINPWGQIVLRQDGGYDDDVWILVNVHDVSRLIERLKELAREISDS